jgi:hypothetical protein
VAAKGSYVKVSGTTNVSAHIDVEASEGEQWPRLMAVTSDGIGGGGGTVAPMRSPAVWPAAATGRENFTDGVIRIPGETGGTRQVQSSCSVRVWATAAVV